MRNISRTERQWGIGVDGYSYLGYFLCDSTCIFCLNIYSILKEALIFHLDCRSYSPHFDGEDGTNIGLPIGIDARMMAERDASSIWFNSRIIALHK